MVIFIKINMKSETIAKVNKVLKFFLIFFFILLALLSVKYKYNDCAKCKFTYEGEKLDINEFLNIYREKCFSIETGEIVLGDVNSSFLIP